MRMFVHAGMAEEGLYRINGNSKVIEKLRMSFDKGENNRDNSVYLNMLLLYIQSVTPTSVKWTLQLLLVFSSSSS